MSDAVFWSEVERCVEDGETVVVARGRNLRGPEAPAGGTDEGLRQTIGLRAASLGELRAELVKRRNRSRSAECAAVIDEVLGLIEAGDEERRDAVRYRIVREFTPDEYLELREEIYSLELGFDARFDAAVEARAEKAIGRTFDQEIHRLASLEVAEATFAGAGSA